MPIPTRSSDSSISSACCLVSPTDHPFSLHCYSNCLPAKDENSNRSFFARLREGNIQETAVAAATRGDGYGIQARNQFHLGSVRKIGGKSPQVVFVQRKVYIFRQVTPQVRGGQIQFVCRLRADGRQVL